MILRVLQVLSPSLQKQQTYSNAKMRYCQVLKMKNMCYNEYEKIINRIKIESLWNHRLTKGIG